MPRRIVSRLIPLEPLPAIRAKDQRSRQLALARRNDGTLIGNPGPELSTAAEKARQEETSKNSRGVNIEQTLALSMKSPDDSSRLVDIMHEAGAPEHALPDAPQSGVNGISAITRAYDSVKANSTNATSSGGAAPSSKVICGLGKEDSIPTRIQHIQSVTASDAKSMATSDGMSKFEIINGEVKLSEPGKPESTASSRPKRSTRKSYTWLLEPDVDWDQDLRPTDDELDKAEGYEGTAVTSPDPEYRNSTERKSPKRKKRQSGPDSSKRRRATKGKPDHIPKEREQSLQLSLTTGPIVVPRREVSRPHENSRSRPLNGQSKAVSTKGTATPPGTLTFNSETQQQCQSQLIVEISSCSPSPLNRSSSGDDVDQNSGHGNAPSNANIQGRGKLVGSKLSDALREAAQSSSLTNEPGSVSTRTFGAGIDHRKANTSASPKSLARISLFQNSLTSESSMDQGQVDFKSNRSTPDPRTLPAKLTPSVPADYLSLPESMGFQGLLKNQGLVGVDANTKAAIQAPIETAMDSANTVDEETANSQEFVQFLRSKADISSQASSAAKTDRQATLLTHDNQSQNTPESEKPLLTKKAPLEFIPLSMPRSIIVDHNGSPRITTNGNKNIIQMQSPVEGDQMWSTEMTDASSSDYDQSSDMYSPGYTPESQRTWSKFHRDIVAEYGIDTEQLIREGDRPISLKKAFEVDTATCGTSLGDRQRTEKLLETRGTTTPRGEDDTAAAPRACIYHDKASATAAISSPGPTDEVGLCTRQHADDRRDDTLPARASGTSQPALEPHRSLMQDDANGMEWISALQTAQRSAHNLLLETNQQLSTQLAAEQDTIRDVLQIYRMGCHRILDDLFRAQEVRMELYRQQMSSVKEQHTQICRELIRGLQELDDRVQQRS
ncbi:uncharacterized protein N7498_003138 [Penicillium cinerascens]|uniref:Uncharacterized protein n=1 Tax=Penicillium cinerascens TaxID=70096 RepID=A0A9W9N1L8_9EURO|nr:uncharacterized protein N7498_003138 [Penicillium cinerascens]KAJ5211492.1 hypothetical protein N7498_003138 [Penicillium cinerascens]